MDCVYPLFAPLECQRRGYHTVNIRKNLVTAIERPFDDYRNAHHGKGADYHKSFALNVHRSIMWEIEQKILLDLLSTYFDKPEQINLLDFACGSGRVLELLEGRVGKATGVDVTASMLEVAADVTERSRLVHCDITRSDELDGERFDLITAFRFFPNAEPNLRHDAMAKLATLLAPGGILIFNNHIRTGSMRHRARVAKAKQGRLKSRKELHSMSDDEAAALVAEHGLALIDERHTGVLPIVRDKKPRVPAAILRSFERMAARVKPLANLAAYKVYVSRQEHPSKA